MGVVRQAVAKGLHSIGYDPIPLQFSTRSDRVLARTLQLAGPINTVVDVGASDGQWSKTAMRWLPNSRFLLYEAAAVHHAALDAFAAKHRNVRVEKRAASDHEGTVHFYSDPANPFGGGASVEAFPNHDSVVACGRIDDAMKRYEFGGPSLVKLDAQGHEGSILGGAGETLRHAALVVIEAYGVGDTDRMAMPDLFAHMAGLGFSPAGMADVMVRPLDGLLWQTDVHFLRLDHAAFADRAYH